MDDFSKALMSYAYCKRFLKENPSRLMGVVQRFLQNIRSHRGLNAFVRVYEEEVVRGAEVLSAKVQQGCAGSLAGLVVGMKDMFCYKDHPVQAASAILKGFVSQIDATVVRRLLAEGAMVIGHQNCDEFGMGSATKNSVYGPAYNALDFSRVAGGSSGGSAVSLQARMCHVSLGTDTGGSVRQPAAFCGLVGFKPTYSLIPRDGVVAYASSFDTVGVLSHTIEDCAAVLGVVAGEGRYDNTSSKRPVPDYTNKLGWQGKAKIAYLKQALDSKGLELSIKEHVQSLLYNLSKEGHEVVGVDFPLLDYALPTYYVLSTAEASANLARYDGVRYGVRGDSDRNVSLQQMYKATRSQGFGKEVQRRILLGTFVLSAGYYDAYYLQAQKVRRLIKESLEGVLSSFDFIVLPTTPTTAFLHSKRENDPTTAHLDDLYTVLASIAGLPAISLPSGKDERGLPIGVQLIAGAFEEPRLLAFSQHILTASRQ